MKNCGNCKWHEQEIVTYDWVCVNHKSKRCANFTMKDDTCNDWEGRTDDEAMKGYGQAMGVLDGLKETAVGK